MKVTVKILGIIFISLFVLTGCTSTKVKYSEPQVTNITKVEVPTNTTPTKEEKVPTLTDKDIIQIVSEGNKKIEEILLSAKEPFKKVDGTDYFLLPTKYDSEDKIRKELSVYWGKSLIDKVVSFIPSKEIEGKYVLPFGELGDPPTWDKSQIKDKKVVDEKNVEVTINFSNGYPDEFIYTLSFEDNSWRITKEVIK